MKLKNCSIGAVVVAFLFFSAASYAADLTISVNAAAPIRTIPETMFGWSMYAWAGYENGYNTTYNNIMKAGSYKHIRWPGGSWGDAYLWSDMEGPNGANGWIINYNEELYTLGLLGATMQPIVNFNGWWYNFLQDDTPTDNNNQNYAVAHTNAVNAAAAWVTDQTSRTPCAQYWEIGNEVYGNWEAGWFSGLNGTYYGDKFADFYIAMKAVNPNIKIGAVAREYDSQYSNWTRNLLTAAYAKGVVPDFLIIHMYPGTNQGASYNPTLLTFDIGEIANFTTSLNSMITTAIGSQYVGQIEYCMTEWDSGGVDPSYPRNSKYVGGMFVAEYLMEMAKNGWSRSNLFGNFFYESWMGQSYYVYPKWYLYPFFINRFGRDMVSASSSNSSIRTYAATDSNDDLTMFIVNNSPTNDYTAQISISGFSASGSAGQMWLMEPAGTIPAGGNIQDVEDIKINGVFHPEPATINNFSPVVTPTGTIFTINLPKSCMIFLKVPAGTPDSIPPDAPSGLAAKGKAGKVTLNWEDNNESDLAGYNIYRSATSGSDYVKLNSSLLCSSDFNDDSVPTAGGTFYYVVTAVDTSLNESDASNEASATIPPCGSTVYTYSGITSIDTNYNAYYCDVDIFPFAGNSGNRNSFVEAANLQYSYIAANDSSEWATTNPGSGDQVFMWNEMKINESPGSIVRIEFTFTGYTTNTSGAVSHKIYVLTANGNYLTDANWTQLGEAQNITPGSYATMTRSLTGDFSKYINANGKLIWGVYETTSYQVMHINYMAMAVYTSGSDAPAAPVNLTAIPGFEQVALDWNDNNETDLAGYNVYRSTTTGYGYSRLNSSLVSESNYVDSNLTGLSYYYVVTAVDSNGNESSYSNQASTSPDVYTTCDEVKSGGYGLLSDINGDCHVDFYDLETIAVYWLNPDCASVANCNGADIAPVDGTVSLYDFSILAQQWRQCNDPQDSRCTPNW